MIFEYSQPKYCFRSLLYLSCSLLSVSLCYGIYDCSLLCCTLNKLTFFKNETLHLSSTRSLSDGSGTSPAKYGRQYIRIPVEDCETVSPFVSGMVCFASFSSECQSLLIIVAKYSLVVGLKVTSRYSCSFPDSVIQINRIIVFVKWLE